MTLLVADLPLQTARRSSARQALGYGAQAISYAELATATDACAQQLLDHGVGRMDRIAIYAEKRFESVIAMFGAARAGAVYIPVNPLLKAEQVGHIVRDCAARVLVTTPERLPLLDAVLRETPSIKTVIVTGTVPAGPSPRCRRRARY